MKVLFFSDAHGSEPALKLASRILDEFDVVIVGGDLTGPGSPDYPSRLLKSISRGGRSAYYVPGNADSLSMALPEGVTQLHGSKSQLGRYIIGGIGGSNITPFKTAFEIPDPVADTILTELGPVDILISHCPPKGCKCDKTGSGHIGSVPVRSYVDAHHPALVLSGHVHESHAVDNLSGTSVVNPGPLRDGRYAVISLNGIISVELKAETLKG